jgi:hypothetical protein
MGKYAKAPPRSSAGPSVNQTDHQVVGTRFGSGRGTRTPTENNPFGSDLASFAHTGVPSAVQNRVVWFRAVTWTAAKSWHPDGTRIQSTPGPATSQGRARSPSATRSPRVGTIPSVPVGGDPPTALGRAACDAPPNSGRRPPWVPRPSAPMPTGLPPACRSGCRFSRCSCRPRAAPGAAAIDGLAADLPRQARRMPIRGGWLPQGCRRMPSEMSEDADELSDGMPGGCRGECRGGCRSACRGRQVVSARVVERIRAPEPGSRRFR